MNNIVIKYLLFFLVLTVSLTIYSQSEPDDFWLNNGFTSGQTIYTNTGNFYDDGGFDLYQPGQNWNVTFCSENGNPITFDFSGFRTYYGGGDYRLWDYMSINYVGSFPLVAYDYDTPQFSFTAPTGCIRFGFRSAAPGISIPDSGWVAEISANPPPVNNDPCDAILLPVDNVCSPSFYSNKGAWDTRGLGSPSCHEFFGGDVWFSAVVPPSGSIKVETLPGSLTYAILVLYRGACSSLTNPICVDTPGAMPIRTFTGLTPGQTVYLRIFGDQAKSGTFGICVTDPSAEITGYTGPGGVGDSISNRLWLRADSGPLDAMMSPASNGSSVSVWLDQSGNENHVKQLNSIAQPQLNSSGLNGRQTLAFNGSQTFMTDTLVSSSAPLGIFTVNSYAISKDQSVLALGNASDLNSLSISRENISNQYYTFTNIKNYGQALPAAPHLLFASYQISSPYHSYSLNGASQSVNFTQGQVATNGAFYLGVDKDGNDFLDGNISEIIIYSKRLNAAQEIIVSNYLAAKYSLTISNDFFEYQATHPFDLAGIGRTDELNIHSRAMSAHILSLGGASSLGDNEFVLFAHDGGDFTAWSGDEIPLGDPDILRLAREWIVDITGDGPGSLSLAVNANNLPPLPAGYIAYNLLVDTDGDFSNGSLSYGLISSGSELIANNVDLSTDCYIGISAVRARVNFSLPSSSGLESLERPEIDVELSHAVSVPAQVNYSVVSGTADQATDYSLVNGYVLFNPGEKVKQIIPLIFDDTLVEIPDEYFTIRLSDPTGGVLAGDRMEHIYTILDDDLSLYITASDSIIGACSASSSVLTAHAQGSEPLSYSWTPLTGLGQPSSAITTANPTETTYYKVTVTDALGGTISDSLLITVEPVPLQPTISVAGDLEFCNGGSVSLSGPDGYAYLWSNGSTEQSIDVGIAGNYTLIITDANGCSSVPSEEIAVIVNAIPPQPVITFTGPATFCEGDSLVLFAPEGYSYLWNTGDTSRSLTVKTSGNYSVIVSDVNSCSSAPSEEVNVLVNPLPAKPVVQANGPLEFCEGGSVTLSAPAGFEYLWDNGETTQSIVVIQNDTLTVLLTDGNSCNSELSDPVIVKVNPPPAQPNVTVNGNLDLCEGETVELIAPEGYSYLWSNGAISRSIVIDQAGNYTVQITDANECTSVSSEAVTVNVTAIPVKPVISASGDLRFCENESIQLTAPDGYTYLWNTGATSQSIEVNTTGSYTVTVSNGNCSSPLSDPLNITVDALPPKPSVTTSGSLEFCEGGSVELSAPDGFSYIWSSGQTSRSIIVNEGGRFAVALANGTCTSDSSDAVEVIVNPNPAKPVITAGSATEFCEGSSVRLSAPAGYSSYIWSNGSLSQLIDVTETGSYNVTVTDLKGCVSEPGENIVITVTETPSQPVISYSGALEFCEGDSLLLSAPAGYEYLWSNGEVTREINVKEQSTYSVIVYNQSCPSIPSEVITVFVNPVPDKPVISPQGPVNLITGQSITLSTGVAPSYLWSTSQITREIEVAQTGEYSVRVFSDKGCGSHISESVLVNVSDKYPSPEVTVEGEVSFCEGGSTILTSEEAYSYLWSNGQTTRSIVVTATDSYTLVIRDVNGTESEPSDPVKIEVYENPAATANVEDVRCFNGTDGSITLTVSGGKLPYNASWTGDYSGLSISGLPAGMYSSVITDTNGCSVSVSAEVSQPEVISITGSITNAFCPDASDGAVSLNISGGKPGYSIRWVNGTTLQTLANLSAGNYSVDVTDANNCLQTKSFSVLNTNEFCFIIPDIITPNNDGKNDTWVIEGLEYYPGVTVEIFDRWGKRVFYSKGYDKDFDGTFNGKDLPMESYHYVINLNNGSPVLIGNITIVR